MSGLQDWAELPEKRRKYIDFVATGGMVVNKEGKLETITGIEMAKRLQVSRNTMYEWRESVPGFWDYVRARRNELYGRDLMSNIYKAMYAKALKGSESAAKLLLQQSKMLEAEKVDITSDGKALPVPIVMLSKDEA